MIGGSSKSRGAERLPPSGYEMDTSIGPGIGEESMRLRQKMNGHSKSMSNAHGGAQYAGQNLVKDR